tara:strand:+ start:3154 stop:3621 length:468 start_codon:yes stop_codon:yes gene_type:complete
MYTKKNARVTFRSNRRPNFKRNNNFSNGKQRNKGNVTQQYNKYLKMAKESFSAGDRIQSEYYYQFTDHYYRLMVELGINLEDDESQVDNKTNEISNSDDSSNENIELEESKKSDNTSKNGEIKESTDDDIESIESIPFISKPAKRKSTRTKKVIV